MVTWNLRHIEPLEVTSIVSSYLSVVLGCVSFSYEASEILFGVMKCRMVIDFQELFTLHVGFFNVKQQ
jgi:hypothetical protein